MMFYCTCELFSTSQDLPELADLRVQFLLETYWLSLWFHSPWSRQTCHLLCLNCPPNRSLKKNQKTSDPSVQFLFWMKMLWSTACCTKSIISPPGRTKTFLLSYVSWRLHVYTPSNRQHYLRLLVSLCFFYTGYIKFSKFPLIFSSDCFFWTIF